jgi:hypothetical protein
MLFNAVVPMNNPVAFVKARDKLLERFKMLISGIRTFFRELGYNNS